MGYYQSCVVQVFSKLCCLRSATPEACTSPLSYAKLFVYLSIPCAVFMVGCASTSGDKLSPQISDSLLSASCARFADKNNPAPVADTYAAAAKAEISSQYPSSKGNPSQDFVPINVESDSLGFHHVKFQQTYAGLPIYNQILIVHLNHQDKPYAISGHPVSLNQIESGRCLSPRAAAERSSSVTLTSTQQVGALQFWLDQNQQARLVYLFDVSAGANSERIVVSALTGAVLKTYPLSYSAD
jgi:Zn-dependent metalloprotease